MHQARLASAATPSGHRDSVNKGAWRHRRAQLKSSPIHKREKNLTLIEYIFVPGPMIFAAIMAERRTANGGYDGLTPPFSPMHLAWTL